MGGFGRATESMTGKIGALKCWNVKPFRVIKSYKIHNICCVTHPSIECIEETTQK